MFPKAKILPDSPAEQMIKSMTPQLGVSKSDIVAALKAECGIEVGRMTVYRYQRHLGLI